MPASEAEARLRAAVDRSDRDTGVHPSTRLPGAPAIQSAIQARLTLPIAVCYADLDHFKEFNDRYSYVAGDRVIRLLATLLHDTVRAFASDAGFVGHIGGDDFIFVIPRDMVKDVCSEVVQTFDTLVAYQYSEHDRRAGYFFGKDRRGLLHRVPLDDSVDRSGDERAPELHARGGGERSRDGDEDVREDAPGLGLRDRSTHRRSSGDADPSADRDRCPPMTPMMVQCSSCRTEFELDPRKMPAEGVRARCSVCSAVIAVPPPPREAERAQDASAGSGAAQAPAPLAHEPAREHPAPSVPSAAAASTAQSAGSRQSAQPASQGTPEIGSRVPDGHAASNSTTGVSEQQPTATGATAGAASRTPRTAAVLLRLSRTPRRVSRRHRPPTAAGGRSTRS